MPRRTPARWPPATRCRWSRARSPTASRSAGPATSTSRSSATSSTRSSRSPRTTSSRALLVLLERAKQVVEPAGAAASRPCSTTRGGFETPPSRALRRQHRPAAAEQVIRARPRGRRSLPLPPRVHPRPPRRARLAARRARRRGRQRARGRPRAHLPVADPQRGRGPHPARDPRRDARRARDGRLRERGYEVTELVADAERAVAHATFAQRAECGWTTAPQRGVVQPRWTSQPR